MDGFVSGLKKSINVSTWINIKMKKFVEVEKILEEIRSKGRE